MAVYKALLASVAEQANAPALGFDGKEVSYRQLLDLVDNVAMNLWLLGIRHGDTFAVYAYNRPEFMYCYYAAAKIGAIFVPLGSTMTPSEVSYSLEHSGAKFLFHDEAVAAAAREVAKGDRCRLVSDLLHPAPLASPEVDILGKAEDDLLIIYTSGSTGTPKAVVLGQGEQVAAAKALSELWDVTDRDTNVVALPLGFLYGLSTASAVGLQTGGRIVIQRRFHPGELLDAFVQEKATIFQGVPAMFSMMLEFVEQRGLSYDLSQMRALISAGAPLADELKDRFARTFKKEIQNYYAMSECTPVFGVYASDPEPLPTGAVGRVAPGSFVRIVDNGGNECPVGVSGELLVRAGGQMRRYLKDTALTATALIDGWFRSGDVGYRDERGYFYITGRIKDIIIRGGVNIAPSEVEQVLANHQAVQDVAVIGVPDRILGEVPIAFIVKRHKAEVSAEDLIAHAEARLAEYKVPRQYFFEIELPLGKTGKIDKKALKAIWSDKNA